ncbi:hypothetical protein V6N13_074467 [Hibiscus sabdariffa]
MYDIAEELDYSGRYVLFWKQYGRRFSVKHLRTSSDIIDMLASMTKNRQVNVYLEEEVTKVRTETGDVTEEETVDAPGGATGDVPGGATGDATEEACGDATSDLHEEATAYETKDAIEQASGDATGDDVTGEVDDVEVDDSCFEEDPDYVVDDDIGLEDYGSGFEDSENSGSDHEGYVHDVNVNNDSEMRLNNDLLGVCHIRVDDDDVNEGEELHNASEFDSNAQKKKVKFPEFNTEADMVTPQFQKGMVFSGKEIFKAAVREYEIKNKVDLKLKIIDSERVHVICKEGCPWDDPTYSSRQLKKDVMHDLVYKVSASKCLRDRNLALEMVMGSHKGHYSMIYNYLGEIRTSNPGRTTILMLDNRVFMRMYICLGACKNGYKSGCRPIISIDGCHLKGYFGGTFLVAIGVDANDNIYPIAYVVVEAESQSSWDWFMSLLAVDLEIESNHNVTFISDKQKMILEARDKPILTLMEMVRTKIMHKIAIKKEEADKCRATHAGGHKYQVSIGPSNQHVVDLEHHSCSCRKWDLTAMVQKNQRPESYVDHCFHITTQQEIYSHFITPMRGPNQWVEDTTCEAVREPKLRRPPGRPKKKRVKEADEPINSISSNVRFTKKWVTIYCSKCGKVGHNQRTYNGEVGANVPVNAPKRKQNQQSDTSIRLPKLQVKRPTTSPSETNPFVFIPTPGLAFHPTTQQSCPTQQPESVMTVRWMPTSQEHCSVEQSLSQSSTLTQIF